MINALLSWLGLRRDTLIEAKKALDGARQIIAAQQITIEGHRELNEHLIFINNELIKLSNELTEEDRGVCLSV
ncbi:hypothetical protein LCGC14_2419640 [marine sediment metagenome]|uniref:PhoU domain-containing protein n=1 Tax=marine sediment metagenome TaxID=412755 RepID=A0A0F9BQ22_9ZZZZ